MIPVFLNDLQLDLVFAAYTNNVDDCILLSNKDEKVVDSEALKVSGFVSPTFGQEELILDKCFDVKNPKHKDFALLKIDNAAIKSNETKKCDCAIMNETFISFIEFKANAYSTKKKKVNENYKKAITQLKITIQIMVDELSKLGKDLKKMRDIDAYVCFRKGYPRFTSTEAQYRVEFVTETGIPLSFEPNMTI